MTNVDHPKPPVTVTFTHKEAMAIGSAGAFLARAIGAQPERFPGISDLDLDALTFAVAALEIAALKANPD